MGTTPNLADASPSIAYVKIEETQSLRFFTGHGSTWVHLTPKINGFGFEPLIPFLWGKETGNPETPPSHQSNTMIEYVPQFILFKSWQALGLPPTPTPPEGLVCLHISPPGSIGTLGRRARGSDMNCKALSGLASHGSHPQVLTHSFTTREAGNYGPCSGFGSRKLAPHLQKFNNR